MPASEKAGLPQPPQPVRAAGDLGDADAVLLVADHDLPAGDEDVVGQDVDRLALEPGQLYGRPRLKFEQLVNRHANSAELDC
jgi:hypothetical protein